MAANGLKRYGLLDTDQKGLDLTSIETLQFQLSKETSQGRFLLARRADEWPSLGHIDLDGVHLHSKVILLGFTIAGLIYGGMHLIAWSAPFPTVLEKILGPLG